METITTIVTAINDFVWGPPMLVLILGTAGIAHAAGRMQHAAESGLIGMTASVRTSSRWLS